MKQFWFCLLLIAPIVTDARDVSRAVTVGLVKEMQAVLKREGAISFIDEAMKQNWPTPHIPTKWHVEHISTGEVQRIEAVSREFGKELVTQLAVLAPKLRQPITQEQRYEYTVRLVNLSEWCAATEGFGNLLLAQRCLNLACVPLAPLVADLSFPAERYTPLLERLKPSWLVPEVRRRILNKEAGAEIFPRAEKQQEELEAVWAWGGIWRRERLDPGFIDREWKEYPEEFAKRRDSPAIRANLDFFADDDSWKHPKPSTLKTRWDIKWHEMLVHGWGEVTQANAVLALAEFRAKVRHFPTEDNPQAPIRGGEGAFREAWRKANWPPPRDNKEFEIWDTRFRRYSSAWSLYNAVQQGDILDEDSASEKAAGEYEGDDHESKGHPHSQ
jgi:hypothetical protein